MSSLFTKKSALVKQALSGIVCGLVGNRQGCVGHQCTFACEGLNITLAVMHISFSLHFLIVAFRPPAVT